MLAFQRWCVVLGTTLASNNSYTWEQLRRLREIQNMKANSYICWALLPLRLFVNFIFDLRSNISWTTSLCFPGSNSGSEMIYIFVFSLHTLIRNNDTQGQSTLPRKGNGIIEFIILNYSSTSQNC
jgi:hypothetical protein